MPGLKLVCLNYRVQQVSTFISFAELNVISSESLLQNSALMPIENCLSAGESW